MTSITVRGHKVRDYAPIQCLLEMTEDNIMTIVVRPGCSVPDVHDMLRLLPTDGHFDHLTIVDEYDRAEG